MVATPETLSPAAPEPIDPSDSDPSLGSPAVRTLPTTMRAIAQHRYGDAHVLEACVLEIPRPGDDQVLIAVAAAGIDRGVWHLMTGLPYIVRPVVGLTRPRQPIPGLDVSGRVVAVGSSVTAFRIGDEVFGVGTGTLAEYAVADAAKLARRPPGVTPEQAAAVPISGLTALQALRDAGRLQAGRHVLVLGASGGVGSFAVQIARHLGARVTGVASTAKLELVRSLGAERVIDHTREDALGDGTRYDLIVDIGGRRPLGALRRALTERGTLVIVGGEGGDRLTGGIGRQFGAMLLSPFVGQRLKAFLSTESGTDVERLGALLAAGDILAPIGQICELDDAPATIADLAAGRVRGKAVVRVGGH